MTPPLTTRICSRHPNGCPTQPLCEYEGEMIRVRPEQEVEGLVEALREIDSLSNDYSKMRAKGLRLAGDTARSALERFEEGEG